jgi:iron-sulfur cluster assembly protein
MITLTEIAAKRVQDIASGMSPEPIGIRVALKGGGCSGFTYVLEFAHEVKPGDRELESHGVKIVSDKKSLLYLLGTQIDYVDELGNIGFKFLNPTAKRTCGCGESFGI